MEKEIWKDVKDYEGIYKVSNKGNVKSLDRLDASGHKRKEKALKLMNDNDGYSVVKLSKNGKVVTAKVHRLVGLAFIPNKKNLPVINHLNEIKNDNRLENLEWTSVKENSNHGTGKDRSGLGRRKPVKAVSIKTGEILYFDSAMSAGKNGFSRHNITSCCKGRLKHHKGYKWSYNS